MRKLIRLTVIASIIPLAAFPMVSVLGGDDFAKDIALGKKYEMTPPPSYTPKNGPNSPCCTEAGDKTQLTDGQADKADNGAIPTVGWEGRKEVAILIDLERIYKIGAVRLNVLGGGGGGVKEVIQKIVKPFGIQAMDTNPSSDNVAFLHNAIPDIWFYSKGFEMIHSPADDLRILDFDKMANICAAAMKTLAHLLENNCFDTNRNIQ